MAQLSRFRPTWPRWRTGHHQLATLLVIACGAEPRPAEVPGHSGPSAPPLTREELRRAAFPSDFLDGRVVTFRDTSIPPGDSSGGPEAELRLIEPVAFGTDPRLGPVAAAIVVESGGGTGSFSWLHLLARVEGQARVIASGYLGDRVEATGLGFAGDTVVVQMVTQGPDDPMCCPTLVVERRYLREGEVLKAVSGER